jgi:hypothetical protein
MDTTGKPGGAAKSWLGAAEIAADALKRLGIASKVKI